MVPGRRMGKTSGTTLGIKGYGKSPAVPQRHPADSPASAKLVVGCEGEGLLSRTWPREC